MPSVETFDQYSPKDKKQRNQPSTVESVSELLQKPTSLIIIILLCVILGMTLQFGQIQSQIATMSKQLGSEKSSGKNLETKFNSMQKDVSGIKKAGKELQEKTSGLEKKEKELEEHDKKYREELNNLEKKDSDPWGQGDDFENNQPLSEKDKESPFPGSFSEFLNGIFSSVDDAVNESPEEKESKGGKDPFFDFPPFPTMKVFGPTGPVTQPHTSINDLFQNIAKPGPHPKFANQDDTSSDDSSPVQELKETNKKPELTEKDKANGIVSDITSHNMPVHHAAPVSPPIVEAPKSETPAKIKLINPVKEALKAQVKKEKESKTINLKPKKIE